MTLIGDAGPAALAERLSTTGVTLDYGSVTLEVRSRSAWLARQMASVYARFPLPDPVAFSDIHVRLEPSTFWRRPLRPQVALVCDGEQQFYPFPADTALPLMEWGTNWLIGQRLHHLLLFHAGCVARDGWGMLLPATPGSGKSTLTAALAHHGWRLLSDEFGVLDPEAGQLRAMIKPIALKNQAIDVIRDYAPAALIGPTFPKTRKGDVAHAGPNDEAVQYRGQGAWPAFVVLPKWTAGRSLSLEPIDDETMFRALAFNSFNYSVLGETGFDAVVHLVRRCRGYQLEYGRLEDAKAAMNDLWASLPPAPGLADGKV